MSASVQKNSFTIIGIHKAPENLSKREFDAKVGAFCDSLVALPVVKKNFLSFDVIFQNSVLDEHMKELGWGEPQPCVVLVAELETVEKFTEFFQDAAVKKLITDADDFAFRPASIAFSAEAVTRIDVPRSEHGSTATERTLWVGIYRGPGPALSPHITQFQENVSAIMDEYVAQPVSQKNMLSHKVWMANDSIAASLQAQGYPKAEPVVVVMIETENWDRGIEICEDAELKRLTEKANQNFGFHVGANCFAADVVSKIKKATPIPFMTDPVTIIIDDHALFGLSLGEPGGWFPQFNSCYNGSVFIPQTNNGSIWEWPLKFDGASVSLFGVTPPNQYNQTIGIADPASNKDITTPPKDSDYRPYTYPSAAFGGQFYTSGTLPAPGQMVLGLSNANGIAIDYVLVTASNSTNLQGQTIIVDDANPEIFWNGSWSAQDNFTAPVPCLIPSPEAYENATLNYPKGVSFTANMSSHANTFHQSSNVGDSFTFQFAGTSLLISGITPGVIDTQSDWLLKMEFTLDGNTTTKVFTPGTDTLVKPHFVYFSATFDAATGNHTLVAKVLDVAGSPPPAVRIDYITYRPSFATIADKPNFPSPAASATVAPSAGAPSASSTAAIQHRNSVGAIVGGVIGGCLLLALLVSAFWLLRRRRTKDREHFAPEPFVSPATPHMHERNGVSKQELLSVDGNALTERRNDLAAEIQNLEESRNGEMLRGERQTVEERLRALQAQMDTLTLEMRQHLVPPSYTGETEL